MNRPTLHVVVFSNFEGFCVDPEQAGRAVRGFEEISEAHPEVVWTHMFNPIHLVGSDAHRRAGDVTLSYLRSARRAAAEIGLHLHMFYDMVRALDVEPRGYPHAGAPVEDCGRARGLTGEGYDVLLTAYSSEERSRLLAGCTAAMATAGLPAPTSFCAGYSAADPALQALIEVSGFTTSFAAQVVPSGIEGVSYPACWYELLEWGERLTPLSRPYRVARDSLLPSRGPYLERLVEVPLNTDTDVRQLFLYREPLSRRNVLDFHEEIVRTTGRSSCVALGAHDAYLGQEASREAVIQEMLASLRHVREIGARGRVRLRYSTVSEVSESLFAGSEPW